MESELLKDVDSLHEAFRIHVNGDPDNRSVLVLAQDMEDGELKVKISCCGKTRNIVDCILMFLEEDENKSLADAVAAHFRRKDRTLKRMAMWVFFISLGWLIFLVWFYFTGMGVGLTLSVLPLFLHGQWEVQDIWHFGEGG